MLEAGKKMAEMGQAMMGQGSSLVRRAENGQGSPPQGPPPQGLPPQRPSNRLQGPLKQQP